MILKLKSKCIMSIFIVFCLILLPISEVFAAELNTNLIINPGGEATANYGRLVSNGWSGEDRAASASGVSDFATPISIEKQYYGKDITSVMSIVPHGGQYYIGFATPGTASVGEGIYTTYQDIDINANQADVEADKIVFNLEGYLSATGGNISTLKLEQLDSYNNVIDTPTYEKSINSSSWTLVTMSGAVAPTARKLRVVIKGTHSACGIAAFDDLSLKISTNESAPPVISQIENQTMLSGKTLGPLSFSVTDADTSYSNIVLSAVSSNTSLIPNSNLSVNQTNGNGTINITAVNGQTGQSKITITASDGTKSTSMNFNVSVSADVKMDVNLISQSLKAWTDPSSRFYYVPAKTAHTHTYNQEYYMYQEIDVAKFSTIIDADMITYSASGTTNANGTVNVIFLNAYGQEISRAGRGEGKKLPQGTRNIRLEVGGSSGCEIKTDISFMINSSGLPKITSISNQNVSNGNKIDNIPFIFGYKDGTAQNLTATSSNESLISSSQITFGGSGYNRTISLDTTQDISGTSTIKIFIGEIELGSFTLEKVIEASSVTVTSENNEISILNGTTLQMQAEVLPSNATNKKVLWNIINGSGAATIDESGLLTATASGTITVRAVVENSGGIEGSKQITINPIQVENIAVSGHNDVTAMLNGETLQMSAIVSPDNAENRNVEWSVTNQTGSATISETGLLTATSYGTVEVTAKSKDGSGIVGSKVITINPVQVNSIDISGEQGKTKIFVGQTLQMNASVIPANAENKDIEWKVNQTGIATITEYGLLTGTGAGKVTVTAIAKDGSNIDTSLEIEIADIPLEITAQPNSATQYFGYNEQPVLNIIASTIPENSGIDISYKWFKDDVEIIGANANTYSVPLGLTVGEYNYFCEVTCEGYSIKSDTAKVSIVKNSGYITNKDYPTTFAYTGSSITQPTKDNFNTNNDGIMSFSWYKGDSTDEGNKLNLTPAEAGIYTLRIDVSETSNVATLMDTVLVTIGKNEQNDISINKINGKKYGDDDFELAISGGSGTGAVVFSVPNDNDVLEINGNIARILGPGEVVITVTKEGDNNYNSKSTTLEVAISKGSKPNVIFPDAGDISYGQKLSDSNLSGGSTELGSFKWTDGNIQPEVGKAGYNVSFIPNQKTTNNYDEALGITKDITVNVNKGVPSIALNVSSTGDENNRQATIVATITGASGLESPTGTVEFADITSGSAIGIVLADDVMVENGSATYVWTGLLEQIYKIKAIYAGDDNYEAIESMEYDFDTTKQEQQDFTLEAIETKVYGEDSFALITYGGEGEGDISFDSSDDRVISISGDIATIHKAGTVNITATKAGDDNFNQAQHTVIVRVDKKALVIKADDKLNIAKGSSLPNFTYIVDGLVGSDSVTKEPVITTNATDTNAVGEYVISISEAEVSNSQSYEISYTNGKLTIINNSGGNPSNPVDKEDPKDNASDGSSGGGSSSKDDKDDKEPTKTPVNQTQTPSAPAQGELPLQTTEQNSTNAPVFTDTENHWAKSDIDFVVQRGLFSGTGDGNFSPNMPMTRGMFVTVLGKLAKADLNGFDSTNFKDVKADDYYLPYIQWANTSGIVNGISSEEFAPDMEISREQMAVMLLNYIKAMNIDLAKLNEENQFADTDEMSTWAKEAVKAIQMSGILSGKPDNKFDPKGIATRAEVSSMLRRFIELIEGI